MPIPFILGGIAVASGLVGAANLVSASSKRSEAEKILKSARKDYDYARKGMEAARLATTQSLDELGETKVNAWSSVIGRWVKNFKRFKNVDVKKIPLQNVTIAGDVSANSLRNMEVASMKATEMLQAGLGSLSAGALAGVAAYGGTMMFATASTGAAISGLSGVAATNATLAWLGGGSLAAGGLGMAGGAAVLGGIVLGPVLAVAGIVSSSKADETLAKAKRDAAKIDDATAKIDALTSFLQHVQGIANQYQEFIEDFGTECDSVNDDVRHISRVAAKKQHLANGEQIDFAQLSEEQKDKLQFSWLMIQTMYQVLKAPLLNKNGKIDTHAQKTLREAERTRAELLGA